jgi:hypothetical protein
MLPKPPFACDLSSEDELAIFENLKPRLDGVWDALTDCDERTYTSVVIPSMTLDQRELHKLVGAPFYEERLLLLLIRLRNPRAHMVYVTSQPVHPMILEYYLNLLTGVPASHARARLTMLSAHDSSPRSLTEKILERPRLIQRLRWAIQDPSRAYMTVFNSTPLERKLSVLLGIPLNGLDPKLSYLGTKSGSRKVFRQAGVNLPAGAEDLKSESDVVDALIDLRNVRPGVRRAVVKLNESFSGEGNAVFTFPESPSRDAIHEALQHVSICAPDQRRAHTSTSSTRWVASSRNSSMPPRSTHRARSTGRAPAVTSFSFRPTIRFSEGRRARSILGADFPRTTGIESNCRRRGRVSVRSWPRTAWLAVSASISLPIEIVRKSRGHWRRSRSTSASSARHTRFWR